MENYPYQYLNKKKTLFVESGFYYSNYFYLVLILSFSGNIDKRLYCSRRSEMAIFGIQTVWFDLM